jgi:uncharacterized protein (DUF488 family)
MARRFIFTIGHSTHSFDHLLVLLSKQDINCLIDVRSVPYSRIAPQFNKPSLAENLKSIGFIPCQLKSTD